MVNKANVDEGRHRCRERRHPRHRHGHPAAPELIGPSIPTLINGRSASVPGKRTGTSAKGPVHTLRETPAMNMITRINPDAGVTLNNPTREEAEAATTK